MNNDLERAQRLRNILEELKEVNKLFPIVVEGKKDEIALRRLGMEGEILHLHRGKNIYEFCEDILDRHSRVVLLMDWDTSGEKLNRKLTVNLRGHWEEFAPFRETIKGLAQKDINDIEGIVKLIERLEKGEQ